MLVAKSSRKVEHSYWLAQKLSDPSESSKPNWFILKKFCKGQNIPIIPSPMVNNRLESYFKIKANCSNSFFASKYSPLVNSSTVPDSLQYASIARSYSFCFNKEVILKIINALNINKAHTHDDISVWIIKLYSKPLVRLLFCF